MEKVTSGDNLGTDNKKYNYLTQKTFTFVEAAG